MSRDKYIGIGLLSSGAAAVISSYGLIAYEANEYNNAKNSISRKECVENIEVYFLAGIPFGNLLSLAGLIVLEETKKKDYSSSLMIKEHEKLS